MPGSKILWRDFYMQFRAWGATYDLPRIGRDTLRNWLPKSIPYGKHNSNQRYIGNIAWLTPPQPTAPYVVINGRLRN